MLGCSNIPLATRAAVPNISMWGGSGGRNAAVKISAISYDWKSKITDLRPSIFSAVYWIQIALAKMTNLYK